MTQQKHQIIPSKYHFTPSRMPAEKINKPKPWQEIGETGIFIHYSWECKMALPLWKAV